MEMEEREKDKERHFNLRMKELELQNKMVKLQPLDFGAHFDVTKHIRFLHFRKKRLTSIFFILKR